MTRTRVLFLCTGNSARSQIAEALLSTIGGDRFEVASAGTRPKGVNPHTIRVLAEAGIDWSVARSKDVTEFTDQPFDEVITVCNRAREACPYFPGARRMRHWDIPDPAEVEGSEADRMAAFRATFADLNARISAFVAEGVVG